ncbi:hypothetical protein QBC44DRAFT_376304 [Cladorrhinum sp. PSN332]|nr:hypothetical protein QBC44DRAFT_376304 [Cladorrhinum sp. PSN332]
MTDVVFQPLSDETSDWHDRHPWTLDDMGSALAGMPMHPVNAHGPTMDKTINPQRLDLTQGANLDSGSGPEFASGDDIRSFSSNSLLIDPSNIDPRFTTLSPTGLGINYYQETSPDSQDNVAYCSSSNEDIVVSPQLDHFFASNTSLFALPLTNSDMLFQLDAQHSFAENIPSFEQPQSSPQTMIQGPFNPTFNALVEHSLIPTTQALPLDTADFGYFSTSPESSPAQPVLTSTDDSDSNEPLYYKKKMQGKWFYFCAWSPCKTPHKAHKRLCELRRHQRSERKPIKCSLCRSRFQQPKDLNRHLKSTHYDNLQVITDPKVTKQTRKCRWCKHSGRYDNVKRHEDTKHRQEKLAAGLLR